MYKEIDFREYNERVYFQLMNDDIYSSLWFTNKNTMSGSVLDIGNNINASTWDFIRSAKDSIWNSALCIER